MVTKVKSPVVQFVDTTNYWATICVALPIGVLIGALGVFVVTGHFQQWLLSGASIPPRQSDIPQLSVAMYQSETCEADYPETEAHKVAEPRLYFMDCNGKLYYIVVPDLTKGLAKFGVGGGGGSGGWIQ